MLTTYTRIIKTKNRSQYPRAFTVLKLTLQRSAIALVFPTPNKAFLILRLIPVSTY